MTPTVAGIIATVNNNQHTPNNALQLNNAIHNKDVMTIRQDFLVCLVALGMVLGAYLTSFMADTNSAIGLATKWFFVFHASFLARALIFPVIFFAMNKHARGHVKTTFWNEWAPDFIQVYNPNRVVEIELTNNNPRIQV